MSKTQIPTGGIADDAVTAAKATGFGKILQVVSASLTTQKSTSSTSFVDTDLTCNITPSATSSKILVVISQHNSVNRASSLARGQVQVLRDSTVIFTPNSWTINMQQTGSDLAHSTMLSFNYLDSPSTTSQVTYKTQMKADTSTNILVSQNGHESTIVLMEVGA
jgi:hypothetical protein